LKDGSEEIGSTSAAAKNEAKNKKGQTPTAGESVARD
jgi:hypothetical protein